MSALKKTDKNSSFIIAEIGTSHNGSLQRAEELITAAADSGADCVKTQIVFADEIIHPNTGEVSLPGGSIRLYDRFLELEQNFNFYARIKELTEDAGLKFLASPFGTKSLDWLLNLDCDSIKIASPELNHFPLLRAAAASGRRLILSSGVSEMIDIEAALETVTSSAPSDAPPAVLMHCITSYPAPETEYKLRLLQTLYQNFNKRFNIALGVSDHSLDPLLVPCMAAAICPTVPCYIEKHITLKNDDGGLDDPIALTPEQFAEMTAAVRNTGALRRTSGTDAALAALREQFGAERLEAVLGDSVKRLAPSEAANYGRTNRSVHALTNLAAGTILTSENTALLRTEKILKPGARPEHWNDLIGKRLRNDIPSGEGVTLSDIE
ncbi:MAG: N-acetylneuraminate synthase family protein [Spirochaetales bacterium]|uniref:N-acetylneuraminate synthase family protein n=1 Tax=Candidatus Thalassospirochaeta sargassi TaxID=3119039 RepID=A0AAJ1IJH7_9SPIO|nr:N-acetylneuraminate synthase family protein [Spirochaetales bacterium]